VQCPVCNHLNSATDVRCFQCRTTLIQEAVGHSDSYRKTTGELDSRMYSGVGAFFGFCLVAVLLKFILPGVNLGDGDIYTISAVGAGIGGLIGRALLRARMK